MPSGLILQGFGSPFMLLQGLGGGASAIGPYTEPETDWNDAFDTHVLPWVIGCPHVTIRDHAIKAARMFCAKTLVWRVRALTAIVTPGKLSYDLPVGVGADLAKLNGVTAAGANGGVRELWTINPFQGGVDVRSQSCAEEIYVDSLKTVSINSNNVGDALTTELILKPSLVATGLPNTLLPYIDDIAHGTIATLALLPGQQWSNPQLASAQGSMFGERINSVGHSVARGYQGTPARRRSRFL